MILRFLPLYTFLLCFVPFFAWIFDWKWQGDFQLNSFDYFLYLLTETSSLPYALITCVVFGFLFLPVFKSKTKWLLAVILMISSMVLTQGIKTLTKNAVAQPRPYVVMLAEKTSISTEFFYAQTAQQKAQIVKQFYADRIETPVWLAEHQANETGYSFPSGHTIFAVSWLFLTIGFTQLARGHKIISILLVTFMWLWTILMMLSRLRLGMHYPIDLFVSILLALAVNYPLLNWFGRKFLCEKASFC